VGHDVASRSLRGGDREEEKDRHQREEEQSAPAPGHRIARRSLPQSLPHSAIPPPRRGSPLFSPARAALVHPSIRAGGERLRAPSHPALEAPGRRAPANPAAAGPRAIRDIIPPLVRIAVNPRAARADTRAGPGEAMEVPR